MKNFPEVMKTSPFFEGIEPEEEGAILKGLKAHRKTYVKQDCILHFGEKVKEMGLLLSGALLIVQEDFWGNRNLIARIGPGDVFAETFACVQKQNINVSVIAEEDSAVLWLDIRNILVDREKIENWKVKLLRNLLENMAEKNLRFNEKLTHMGKRNTREKLLSYLSAEAQKHGTSEFDIPFSRQQLADYLSVERSAMSTELGKLRDEGLLSFRKNHFILNKDAYLQ